jgi:hypothetical protein
MGNTPTLLGASILATSWLCGCSGQVTSTDRTGGASDASMERDAGDAPRDGDGAPPVGIDGGAGAESGAGDAGPCVPAFASPTLHRPEATTCAPRPDDAGDAGDADAGDAGDAGTVAWCVTDLDCANGGVCECDAQSSFWPYGHCVPGNCRVDSDCGPHGLCSPDSQANGCGGYLDPTGYYCSSGGDMCGANCTNAFFQSCWCTYDGSRFVLACGQNCSD